MLQRRIEIMLETVLDVSGIHGSIVMREMVDPSAALPLIVKQFIDPQRHEMDRIVARLAPELTQAEIELLHAQHRRADLLLPHAPPRAAPADGPRALPAQLHARGREAHHGVLARWARPARREAACEPRRAGAGEAPAEEGATCRLTRPTRGARSSSS